MLKLVFDSNIYIAAMAKQSFCRDLLVIVLADIESFNLFISDAILTEIWDTSNELIKQNAIQPVARDLLLALVLKSVVKVQPDKHVIAVTRDPDDDKILECAMTAMVDMVITMDQDLLKLKTFRSIAIVHPRTFFYMLPTKL